MNAIKPCRTLFLALGSAGLIAASSVLTAQPYWPDTGGTVIRDGFGGCVQTRDWKPELATVACGAPAPKAAPAPAPAPVAAPRAPIPVPLEQVSLRSDSLFAFGSDELSPAARRELDSLAQRIRGMPSVERIDVVGHTDSVGAAAFNQALSERRASSVKRHLVERGIDGNKITTMGYGLTRPIADNATAEGRSANRRVEITIHGTR